MGKEKKLKLIKKELKGAIGKAKTNLKKHKSKVKSKVKISDKDLLMNKINERSVNFSVISKKGVTKKQRDDFIDEQKKDIEQLLTFKLSLHEKAIYKCALKTLDKYKKFPVKK